MNACTRLHTNAFLTVLGNSATRDKKVVRVMPYSVPIWTTPGRRHVNVLNLPREPISFDLSTRLRFKIFSRPRRCCVIYRKKSTGCLISWRASDPRRKLEPQPSGNASAQHLIDDLRFVVLDAAPLEINDITPHNGSKNGSAGLSLSAQCVYGAL
jgi:hypothetical protein